MKIEIKYANINTTHKKRKYCYLVLVMDDPTYETMKSNHTLIIPNYLRHLLKMVPRM